MVRDAIAEGALSAPSLPDTYPKSAPEGRSNPA